MTTLTAAPEQGQDDIDGEYGAQNYLLAHLAATRAGAEEARLMAAQCGERARKLAYELHYAPYSMSCLAIAKAIGCSVSTVERLVARERFARGERG